MGNLNENNNNNNNNNQNINKIKTSKTIQITDNSYVLEEVKCPFCNKILNKTYTFKQVNNHLKKCGKIYMEINKSGETFSPAKDNIYNLKIFENIKIYNSIKKNKIKNKISFDDKITNLKKVILSKKISWEKGCCTLNLNRNNLLYESMEQIKNVDLYKELKINFYGEISYDAGGIIREWFTTLFKTLESDHLNLFKVSDSNDFSYLINPFLEYSENNYEYFTFIGKLMAKALLDNITLNLCFNKLIYKIFLEEEINFDDLVFIDNPLYNSFKNLLNLKKDNIENLDLYYYLEMEDKNKKMHNFELIKNGKNTIVKDIKDYIKKRIDFMIGQNYIFIDKIKKGFYSIIPKSSIQNFTSDELDLILNGRPFIDIEEWKLFTEYKSPYNSNHYIIKWFWEILSKLNPFQLSNFLQFSTGSSRVPLGGFQELESNRGNISRFTIIQIPYVPKVINFIKAHTCFNRIEIPLFPNKELLKNAIEFVSNNEILGFGID